MFVKLGDNYLNLDNIVGFGATDDGTRATMVVVGDPEGEYELPITPRTLDSIMRRYDGSQNDNRVLDYSSLVERDDYLPPEKLARPGNST